METQDDTVLDLASASESVDRLFGVIEAALCEGDVEAAQARLKMLRRALLGAGGSERRERAGLPGGVGLTGQEIVTLRQLPDGSLSQKDMAIAMGVSRNTLKTHLKSLYLKLGAHCRSDAINRGREIGLLPQPLTLVPLPHSDARRIA